MIRPVWPGGNRGPWRGRPSRPVLRRIGGRVAAGVVLAALIVGAATLAGVETETRLPGYPSLAPESFVVAPLPVVGRLDPAQRRMGPAVERGRQVGHDAGRAPHWSSGEGRA